MRLWNVNKPPSWKRVATDSVQRERAAEHWAPRPKCDADRLWTRKFRVVDRDVLSDLEEVDIQRPIRSRKHHMRSNFYTVKCFVITISRSEWN